MPVGKMTGVCRGEALVGLWFNGQKYFQDSLKQEGVGEIPRRETRILKQTEQWLTRYFAGERPGPEELSLAPMGSPFRQEVWRLLLEIPYGSVTTYGEIAGRIAARRGLDCMSPQAVGGAVGHNPISVIIPCHRVVGAGGNLTGYAGGLLLKQTLLALEGVVTG